MVGWTDDLCREEEIQSLIELGLIGLNQILLTRERESLFRDYNKMHTKGIVVVGGRSRGF